MRDPYDILGVPRTASEAEIRRAFRRRAKRLHPDANKDDPRAAQRFAELSAAYDLVGDPRKRAAYDRGEIDAEGKPRAHEFSGFGGGFHGFRAGRGGRGFRPGGGFGRRAAPDLDDFFSDLFTGAEAAGTKGSDVAVTLPLALVDAVNGARRRIELPTGRTLDVMVPPGIEDGKAIRLKGQGMASPFGGPNGDAIVTVRIEPHPLLKLDGANLRLDLPVTLPEAVLGAKVRAPTLEGAIELTVPAGSNSGRTLRLRGRGARKPSGERGDLLVTLRIVLPAGGDADLEALMRRWRTEKPYQVRGPEFDL